ncbi:MAG: cytochrome d ubiquinol oxidase subunit II [Pseudomonadota bacterium]
MDAMLPYIWAGIIAFGILVYVVLDGFDLGVGVLFGTTGNEAHRRQMMASVAPVWDGNETWLLVIGAGLFGAFPIVYAIFLSAFYLPVILLLVALIFRGVAFEFRYKTESMRWLWDWGFFLGSTIAAFVQGAAIGAMVDELPIQDGRFVGASFFWLTPFAVCCGVGLVLGYSLLGVNWLILKTEGELRDWAYRRAPWLLLAVLVFLAIVFVYALSLKLDVMQRWLQQPVLWVFPAIGALAVIGCYLGIQARRDAVPFLMTALIFICAFGTMAVSFWPYMVPYSLTIEEAAAPPASLSFLFYGAGLFVIPVILIYTIVVYWIFRGKVHPADSYG